MIAGRVALVQPPLAVGDSYHLTEPIGLLQVGAALREAGVSDIRLLDLSLEFAEGKLPAGPEVASAATERLRKVGADTYAFSVQCVDLPLVLTISRRLKSLRPDARIVLGGHEASLLGHALTARFGCIDEVITGAGESYLGIPPGRWLEPAYDLAPEFSRYARVSRQPTGLVEVGRGCPYDCSYCSIPRAVGRRVTRKPVAQIVSEIDVLAARGCHHVHLVHDTLTLSRQFVSSLIEALRAREGGLTWSGMTRADLVDPPLLAELARSGCQSLLIGVDAGNDDSLRLVNKRARRYPHLVDLAAWHLDAGIASLCYFLVDLPGDTRGAIEQSLLKAAAMSVIDPGCCRIQEPRVVPGTPLASRSGLGLRLNAGSPYAQWLAATVGDSGESWDLIAEHPDVFSTYYKATGPLDHSTASALSWTGTRLFESMPLTLTALGERGRILDLFDELGQHASGPEWRSWTLGMLADAVRAYLRDAAADLIDVVRFEQWLRAEDGVLRSRVDFAAARRAVLDRRPLTPALSSAQRLYRHVPREGGEPNHG